MSDFKNKIKVIISFYNPGNFLELCVNSVLTQNYDNYEVLFINDSSTDGSPEKYIPQQLPRLDENGEPLKDENGNFLFYNSHPILDKTKCLKTVYWKSGFRVTALPNLHNGIMQFATDPDDLIVILDGDDWLINKNVLSYINDFYNKNPESWLMYGSSSWSNGGNCCARPYTKEDFEKGLRKVPFKVSHIRTFRAGLYHSIKKQDPSFSCMMDEKGEWYTITYDVAMFLPMLEMAGIEHVFYNDKKLYVYNRDNPISDDKVNQMLQWQVHEEINKKKPFKKIESYK
jgi:glycosyltransferase involved in cell wall biosynthesis